MIIIRKAVFGDLLRMTEIENSAFGEKAWSKAMYIHELTDADKHYFAAEEDGLLIAYAGFAHILDEAHIMNIAVALPYRKRGTGSALIREMLSAAKILGIERATLEVDADNVSAISIYEKLGFKAAGRRKDYYGKGADALIYWLEI